MPAPILGDACWVPDMSPEDIARVRRGFARIVRDRHGFSAKFYEALFQIDPGMRELFNGDLDFHGERFLSSLGLAVGSLENLNGVADELRAHGRSMAKIGIKNRHYSIAAEALLDALEAALGDHFDQRERAAWATVYAKWADITSGCAEDSGRAVAGGP